MKSREAFTRDEDLKMQRMIARGLGYREVGIELDRSEKSVRSRAMRLKAGIKNMTYGYRARSGPAIRGKPPMRADDERYVAACVAAGGFTRANAFAPRGPLA